MAFSSNGKFGHILIDDVTNNQDTWYNLAQVGSGLSCTLEINAVSVNVTGQQRIYLGVLPNGGSAPSALGTLNDLEVIEYGALLVYGAPFIRNAIVMANQESLYIYADNVDVDFRAFGFVRTEA